MSPHIILPTVARCDYEIWRVILNDSKLSKNINNVSVSFGIQRIKAEAIINEYQQSGCIVMQSKMNLK